MPFAHTASAVVTTARRPRATSVPTTTHVEVWRGVTRVIAHARVQVKTCARVKKQAYMSVHDATRVDGRYASSNTVEVSRDVRARAQGPSTTPLSPSASQGWRLSDRDYPEGEVILGLEIRSHSIKAALVDTANAEFQRPGVVVPLEDITEQALAAALTKVQKHFSWKGPVGMSYTRLVVRALGGTQKGEELLDNMIPEWRGKVATMIHTEAAAYAEMYFGPGRENSGLVLVCTLGKGFGAVLYDRGQKVRNADFKHLTWTYERELKKLQKEWNWSGVVPQLPADGLLLESVEKYGLSGSGWWLEDLHPSDAPCDKANAILAWASLVDKYLKKICETLAPERLILLPTGGASTLPEDTLLTLFRPGIQQAGLNPDILYIGEFPDRALVKGAAVGAHIELQSKGATNILRNAICQTVTESTTIRALTDAELDWVFKKLDVDKDKRICENDLVRGSCFFGANLSIAEVHGVVKEVAGSATDKISREQLGKWWDAELSHSVVTQITSTLEFEEILSAAKAKKADLITRISVDEGDKRLESVRSDKIVVVKSGFSYCRPCKKFESSYEAIARSYPDICFLKVLGDSTPAAAHLCKDVLEVRSTPDFRIFKGDVLVSQFTGANKMKLEEAIQKVLAEN